MALRRREINPVTLLVAGAIGYDAYQKGKNPFWAIIKWMIVYPLCLLLIIGMIVSAFAPKDEHTPIPAGAVYSRPVGIPTGPPGYLGEMLKDAVVVDDAGKVVTRVHAGRAVRIIGVKGDLLKIWLDWGVEGFVAKDIVNDTGKWAGSVPVASPAFSPPAIPAAPPAATAVDRLGQMIADAEVVDATGTVIGMLHAGRPVHIIGVDAGRLRIRKQDGQAGFVAADSVVDVGEWVGSVPERTGSP